MDVKPEQRCTLHRVRAIGRCALPHAGTVSPCGGRSRPGSPASTNGVGEAPTPAALACAAALPSSTSFGTPPAAALGVGTQYRCGHVVAHRGGNFKTHGQDGQVTWLLGDYELRKGDAWRRACAQCLSATSSGLRGSTKLRVVQAVEAGLERGLFRRPSRRQEFHGALLCVPELYGLTHGSL